MELIMSSLHQLQERVKSTVQLTTSTCKHIQSTRFCTSSLASPLTFFLSIYLKNLNHLLKLWDTKIIRYKGKVPPNTVLEHKEKKDTVWLFRSWQASGQETSKHTIVSKCASALLEKKAPWTQTGRASNLDEGLFGMTLGERCRVQREKQSNRERGKGSPRDGKDLTYSELRSLNLILKTTESPLQDFKWDLNDLIRFAF